MTIVHHCRRRAKALAQQNKGQHFLVFDDCGWYKLLHFHN